MRKILYVDMDGVLADFGEAMARQPREVLEAYAGRPDEIPGIFADMVPMPQAIESFLKLSQLFDTYILSTAPWGNDTAWSDKHRWVKKHLGTAAHKRLILTHHKNLNRGDFLVDDRTKHGVDLFGGEHIHFGTETFPDWPAVVTYLERKA